MEMNLFGHASSLLVAAAQKAAPAAAAVSGAATPGVAAPEAPSAITAFLPLAIIFVIFWFLIINPQRKQAKEHTKLLSELKRGDKVVTSGGIHGVIAEFREADQAVSLEVAPGIRISVNRSAIATVKRDSLQGAPGK